MSHWTDPAGNTIEGYPNMDDPTATTTGGIHLNFNQGVGSADSINDIDDVHGDDADIDCLESGTTQDKSLGSKTHGCCRTITGTQTGALRIAPKCSTLAFGDESGVIDLRVQPAPGTDACVPYTFEFGDS